MCNLFYVFEFLAEQYLVYNIGE